MENGGNWHEMLNPVFWGKLEKYHQFVVCWIRPESGHGYYLHSGYWSFRSFRRHSMLLNFTTLLANSAEYKFICFLFFPENRIWLIFFLFFPENNIWHIFPQKIRFGISCKQQFAWNVKSYFSWKKKKKKKNKKKYFKMLSAEIFTQNAKCQADKKESWKNSELNGDWL